MTTPWINASNRLFHRYYQMKTFLVYRPIFRSIGMKTAIHKPLFISNPQYISLGERVLIREGVRMEMICSDLDIPPELSIGSNTNIEQNVHIVCHRNIIIGADVSITANCAITDVTHPYSDPSNPMKIGDRISKDNSYVEIGKGSFLGFGTVVLPNVRIGEYVIVGANSVVTKDIDSFCVAAGSPARILKRYDPVSKLWRGEI